MINRRHFPDTPEGHGERLKLCASETHKVLTTKLARDPRVVNLGMQISFNLEVPQDGGSARVAGMTLKDLPEKEDLAGPIIWARPFNLANEPVHWPKIVASLRSLVGEDVAKVEIDQVDEIWSKQPFKRVYYMKATTEGENLLPKGGVDGGTVAQRLLYSEYGHLDDASEILDHVEDSAQLWNLAGMVADWMATLSYQERVMHLVAPEIVPQLTEWAGDQRTIFERMGAKVVPKEG